MSKFFTKMVPIEIYAHILQVTSTVKPGDKVKVGDKLALSGSSGYSTGSHLHFVIRKNIGMKVTGFLGRS